MRARASSHGTRETSAVPLSLDRLKLTETARSLRLISHSLLAGQALKGEGEDAVFPSLISLTL